MRVSVCWDYNSKGVITRYRKRVSSNAIYLCERCVSEATLSACDTRFTEDELAAITTTNRHARKSFANLQCDKSLSLWGISQKTLNLYVKILFLNGPLLFLFATVFRSF